MALVEQDKEKTFTMVFDKNYEALCLYAVKFTEDFWEAEDIVQESFVRFWEMYRDRLTTENARPLLYRITRNMCVYYLVKMSECLRKTFDSLDIITRSQCMSSIYTNSDTGFIFHFIDNVSKLLKSISQIGSLSGCIF